MRASSVRHCQLSCATSDIAMNAEGENQSADRDRDRRVMGQDERAVPRGRLWLERLECEVYGDESRRSLGKCSDDPEPIAISRWIMYRDDYQTARLRLRSGEPALRLAFARWLRNECA